MKELSGKKFGLKADGLSSGMTLVEMMVALGMLAIGLVAVLSLNVSTMQTAQSSANNTIASFLIESQSEYLRSMDYNRVAFVSQKPEQLTPSGLLCSASPNEPCLFTRTTTITAGAPTSTSSAVSIKVEWGNKSLVYDTVVSAIGFF